jgi:TonB family protein
MAGRTILGLVSILLLVPVLARAQAVATQPGVDAPRVLREVRPSYTPEAIRAGIEGHVQLEVVIQKDGRVGEVTVVRSLDATNGLDQEAIRTVKLWLFHPARLRSTGEAVDYRATIDLSFRMFQTDFGAFELAMKQDTPNLIPPKALTTVQANYTPEARVAGIKGVVLVEVVVRDDGRVADARIKQSLDSRPSTTVEIAGRTLLQSQNLDNEALHAARQWTFEPATLNGKRVDAITTLTFDFRGQ